MNSKISKTGLMLRGFAMGIAEVIPGVSGGTIAFISGIYTQ
jgi:putative membrane protein